MGRYRQLSQRSNTRKIVGLVIVGREITNIFKLLKLKDIDSESGLYHLV